MQPREGAGRIWRWVVGVVIAVAAGAGAVLAPGPTAAIACVFVLALAAGAVGWLAGERHREVLQREIGDRSSELRKALTELEIAQAETVRRLSMAVEFRDEDTGAHIERIGRFSTLLAEAIGMEEELCARMVHAAPLHDVGKVAIPDAILLKPAALTPQERAIVETHAEEGHRLLKGSSSAILDLAATIALSHHEKWDGSGYPRGIVGEAIPIEGRIVAIADVFDALTSDRVYRKAFTVDEAVAMMRAERGRHFDPVLLDAFLEVLGSSGPDAREQVRADPIAVADSALESFVTALERSDAELAEGAVAQAIEDGDRGGGAAGRGNRTGVAAGSPSCEIRGRSTPSASGGDRDRAAGAGDVAPLHPGSPGGAAGATADRRVDRGRRGMLERAGSAGAHSRRERTAGA